MSGWRRARSGARGSENISGELGDGTTNPTSVPVRAIGISDASQVAAGSSSPASARRTQRGAGATTTSGRSVMEDNYGSLAPVTVLAGL